MLDIVGNMKIDESKPERVDYFISCLKSWKFFKEHCKIILNIENASDELLRKVKRTFEECKFDGFVSSVNATAYGKTYCELMDKGTNPFVLNFFEDHFTLLDDSKVMWNILEAMQNHKIDVLKTTFFKVEQNSQDTLKNSEDIPFGRVFLMDEQNHVEYGTHYGSRYYLGVNFLTTRDFAYKFWNRDCGYRPHEYEIGSYTKEWEHICMIPSLEIQCAVDDDHGEEGTCLMKRNEEKWSKAYPPSVSDEPVIERKEEKSDSEPVIIEKFIAEAKPPIEKTIYQEPAEEVSKKINDVPFVFNDLRSENEMFLNSGIEKRMNDVMRSGVYLLGDQSQELETRLIKFLSVKHCLVVKNCTDAIMMVLKYILRERPGATVILPNFGAYATAIAVKNCTDNIHFVDVDESLTIDVKKLPDNIKNGIVIAVHLFGNNANTKHLKRYCMSNNNILIEDCAQSLGSGCGNAGDFSVFSFYPTNPLGSMGDGGAICTKDKRAHEELLAMRNYGIIDGVIEHAGINSRMGEMECAVVNAKINGFEKLIEKRTVIANRYKKIVGSIHINSNCIYHQFPVLFNDLEKVIDGLNKSGIPYRIHYQEHISDMPVFEYLHHHVGFRVNEKIISLPCHAFMEEEHIQKVEEFLKEHQQYEH